MLGNRQKQDKFLFIMAATMIWGLIGHGYCFFNLNLSHDSLIFYQERDIPAMLSVGRFMHPVYFFFRGNTYPPALVGFLSLAFIGMAAYLTAELLGIEGKRNLILTSGVMTVNSVVALTNATYIHDADLYAMALLLAVLSVTVCRRGKWGFLPAILPAVLSLGFYQSYIQVTVILHMILAVLALLRQEKAERVFRDGLKAVVCLVISLIVYYALYLLLLRLTGTAASENYNTLSNAGSFDSAGQMLRLMAHTVVVTLRGFRSPSTYHPKLIAGVNALVLLLTAGSIAVIVKERKLRGKEAALLIALLLLMPFGVNVVCFISKGVVHQLMLYSLFYVYLFALTVWDIQPKKTWLRRLMPALIAVVLANSVIYSNQIYLKKAVEYDATCMVMNRIVDRMEQTEGYVYGETPVAFVGTLIDSPLTEQAEDFDYRSVGLWHSYSVTFPDSYGLFLNNVMQYSVNLITGKAIDTIAEQEEVRAMGYFPARDSVKLVDGILVVKLSENIDHSQD